MVVARKTDVLARSPVHHKDITPSLRKRRQSTGIESRTQHGARSASEPIALPLASHPGSMPLWLLRLLDLNRQSSILAFLVVAATLIVYGWTVYSQELWSQSYRRLQSLQRQERQLITTNAALTSKMADDAELPAAGLLPPSTVGTIFLSPASESSKDIIHNGTHNLPVHQENTYPLGY